MTGFGTVYKSTNKLDGHEYAIKKIRLSSAWHWRSQLEKMLREVKILALLDHPNVIRYYQAWLERHTESGSVGNPAENSMSDSYFDESSFAETTTHNHDPSIEVR